MHTSVNEISTCLVLKRRERLSGSGKPSPWLRLLGHGPLKCDNLRYRCTASKDQANFVVDICMASDLANVQQNARSGNVRMNKKPHDWW